jgi:hypothetical protein
LYSSSNIIKVIEVKISWTEHAERMGSMRNAYILVGKPEGKRPPGRPEHRWHDNIKVDLKEIG